MFRAFGFLILTCLAGVIPAVEVPLIGPLTTIVPAEGPCAGARRITATVTVPDDAPADLGMGVFVRDRDCTWFQRALPGILKPGIHQIDETLLGLADGVAMTGTTVFRTWDALTNDRGGLFFWTACASSTSLRVDAVHLVGVEAAPGSGGRYVLRDLHLDGVTADGRLCRLSTGERWTVTVVPEPFPSQPFEPGVFTLDADISGPEGLRSIPGFFVQPMELSDRGDNESGTPAGASRFEVRFRAREPGAYHVRLVARWADGGTCSVDLPPLLVEGPSVDTLVRVDPEDPRFFMVDGAWWWPIGLNLHSTYDLRSKSAIGTVLTPPRGSLVYQNILPRMAQAGIDLCEIWMSSWNLALEWRGDWPGFGGLGRYNQGNAARLDRVLDLAWANGIRVNVVVNNHGQASPKADREWKDNPLNVANGGPLANAEDIFSSAEAAESQERLRRYLVARFADHPAILGWKLWSEVDLTAGRGEPLVRWHEKAAERWRILDSYGHACTTHWCGTYTHVNQEVAALDGLGYLCIDAYRGASRDGKQWSGLHDLLAASLYDQRRGLDRFTKPLLTTEYGVSNTCPQVMRETDLRLAHFAALVSGHGGAPMTWWWEWVDQGDRWQAFRAIRAFVIGEDLRGKDSRSLALGARGAGESLSCRVWARPGRILGHLVDSTWATTGAERRITDATIRVGDPVESGRMRVEWWNPDTGVLLSSAILEHLSGAMELAAPAFSCHLAFKLIRLNPEDESSDVKP